MAIVTFSIVFQLYGILKHSLVYDFGLLSTVSEHGALLMRENADIQRETNACVSPHENAANSLERRKCMEMRYSS